MSTVEYVYNTKCRPQFIAADGHAETQRISESLRESCSVVNKLLRSKYVADSKRRRRLYQSTGTPKTTTPEQNLILYALVNLKPK